MKKKLILGITGGTGTGKSTILEYLKKLGFLVIDADVVARKIVMPGSPALFEIRQAFGDEVIGADGALIRKKLGDIVFTDKNKLNILNKITHKYVKEEILNILKSEKREKIAIEAAVLFKGDLSSICDYTIGVLADPIIRKNRIIARDALTPKQAEDRILSQDSDEYYISLCDFIVVNNENIEKTHSNVKKILDDIGERNENS